MGIFHSGSCYWPTGQSSALTPDDKMHMALRITGLPWQNPQWSIHKKQTKTPLVLQYLPTIQTKVNTKEISISSHIFWVLLDNIRNPGALRPWSTLPQQRELHIPHILVSCDLDNTRWTRSSNEKMFLRKKLNKFHLRYIKGPTVSLCASETRVRTEAKPAPAKAQSGETPH